MLDALEYLGREVVFKVALEFLNFFFVTTKWFKINKCKLNQGAMFLQAKTQFSECFIFSS